MDWRTNISETESPMRTTFSRTAKGSQSRKTFRTSLGATRAVRSYYEGTRIRRGALRSTTVPTANERIGDFSAAAAALVHTTYPTLYDQSTGLPFGNNQIPTGKIDPLATKIMGLFPAPTVSMPG